MKPTATAAGARKPVPPVSGGKRDAASSLPLPGSSLGSKKPKLAPQTFTPLGRPAEEKKATTSVSSSVSHLYEEIALEGVFSVNAYKTLLFLLASSARDYHFDVKL